MTPKLFRLINPLVVAVSVSPAHALVSAKIIVLLFNGRKSGRLYRIPVSFLEHPEGLCALTDRRGLWWRNLLETHEIAVYWRGKKRRMHVWVEHDNVDLIKARLGDFCRQSRASAFFSGIRLDRNRQPLETDLKRSAQQHVLIKLMPC